jgi:hypothetical protein
MGEKVRSAIVRRASKGEKSEENEEDGGENGIQSAERIYIFAQAARGRHTRPPFLQRPFFPATVANVSSTPPMRTSSYTGASKRD